MFNTKQSLAKQSFPLASTDNAKEVSSIQQKKNSDEGYSMVTET